MYVSDLKPTKLIHSDLADLPLNLSRVSTKTALWMITQPIFHGCFLTHLAECRGAALGDLSLQHANQFTELHTIIELLHEKLCSHLLACKVERHQIKSTVKCK